MRNHLKNCWITHFKCQNLQKLGSKALTAQYEPLLSYELIEASLYYFLGRQIKKIKQLYIEWLHSSNPSKFNILRKWVGVECKWFKGVGAFWQIWTISIFFVFMGNFLPPHNLQIKSISNVSCHFWAHFVKSVFFSDRLFLLYKSSLK